MEREAWLDLDKSLGPTDCLTVRAHEVAATRVTAHLLDHGEPYEPPGRVSFVCLMGGSAHVAHCEVSGADAAFDVPPLPEGTATTAYLLVESGGMRLMTQDIEIVSERGPDG